MTEIATIGLNTAKSVPGMHTILLCPLISV